jgi:hypothetical protein
VTLDRDHELGKILVAGDPVDDRVMDPSSTSPRVPKPIRRLADVKVQVEVAVVDPIRVIKPERHLPQTPPQRRQQAKRSAIISAWMSSATSVSVGLVDGSRIATS